LISDYPSGSNFFYSHTNKGIGAAFEKVPDLIEKFMEKKKEQKGESEA
jgi:hypothetical protein